MNHNILITPRLDQAMRTAAIAHRDHKRKSTDIPYIVHLFSVMTLVSQETHDEDVLIAALLHDTLEDVADQYSREDMLRDFGERVVAIVEGVTKDDTLTSWRDRSESYLSNLKLASDESVIVAAADKLHNLQSTLTDLNEQGEKLWDRFNSGKYDQLWWYESVANVIAERLPDSILTAKLRQLVVELRQNVHS